MSTSTNLVHADRFFSTARERYRIKLKREAGQPWPWTDDENFKRWRFTNVHREDDATTVWFRENLRSQLVGLKVINATVIFRWFNRISTGEIIKDLILNEWDSKIAYERLVDVKPVVTGAYIIKAGDGVTKLEGILECIDKALPQLEKMHNKWGSSLEQTWRDLKTIDFLGGFMAYEIVTDLRHTDILTQALDVMTWANLGPGAVRGMSWLVHNRPDALTGSPNGQRQMLTWMRDLLIMSQLEEFWPQAWKPWELHEIEMWLCEFAKYMASANGIPQKRRYQRG